MPATLQEVKRKIQSTKKTGQITGAMQMISTVKLSQIQNHAKNYQIYASKIQEVISHLAKAHFTNLEVERRATYGVFTDSNEPEEDDIEATFDEDDINLAESPLLMLQPRPLKKLAIMVITSDRGLVGGYNSNVLKQTMDLIASLDLPKEQIKIIAIGRTGYDFFKKQGYKVIYKYIGVADIPKFQQIRPVVNKIVQMYNDGRFDELRVCHNHFVNMLTSEFKTTKMLPLSMDLLGVDPEEVQEQVENKMTLALEYETVPSEEEILEVILPQYAESLVYGAILDAKTAEHSSSATAMRSATDNANEIISTLQLQYNRARQAAITTEITEITGAQAALE